MDLDIETLAKYPMESDDWMLTVLIGSALAFFSALIVPMFAIAGYMVRTLRAGMEGADEPPVFDEWGDMLKEGFVAAIIYVVYQIIPIIVFFVFVFGSLMAMVTGSEAGVGLGFFGFLGAFFAWWVLSLVFGYVGVIGIANYAKEGSFGAGFDFGVITTVATSRDYVVAWLYVICVNIVVSVITSILYMTFIGGIFAIPVSFYGLIIAGWLLGNGFASANGDVPETTTDVDAAVA